jgi:hypothetical protein
MQTACILVMCVLALRGQLTPTIGPCSLHLLLHFMVLFAFFLCVFLSICE